MSRRIQATIFTLKAKLRRDDLMVEEAEILLDDEYEAMKEVQGWTEDGDELALLVGKPHFKKIIKGQCRYCGKYGHKVADCHERKANLETRRMNKVNLSPIRTENQSGNRVIKKERRNLTSQRLNVSTVTNMGTLPKIALTRMTKQI